MFFGLFARFYGQAGPCFWSGSIFVTWKLPLESLKPQLRSFNESRVLKRAKLFLGLILGNFLPHWDPIATGEPVCDPETPLLCPKKPTYIGNLLKIE